jgi:hypothetical protein
MSGDFMLRLHPAWSGFLVLLLFVQLTNHMGTRLWPSSVAGVLGQLVLLDSYLPWSPLSFRDATVMVAFVCFLAAGVVVYHRSSAGRERPQRATGDRCWLDFRDAYGVVWGLRVLDRMNHLAVQQGWPIRLTWNGFVATGFESSNFPWEDVERCFEFQLAKFVSDDWMARRRR